jgi:S-adenosylmethionine:tRNA ribosyltransferase-isomerase
MNELQTADFDYDLPKELIAQIPLEQRDASRLMALDRAKNEIKDGQFTDLKSFLNPGDVLVMNNSRVIPARLQGHKKNTGGKVELLLLERREPRSWLALVGGKRLTENTQIVLEGLAGKSSDITAIISSVYPGAVREVVFDRPIMPELNNLGKTPLPLYIHETLADPERYQTVYSRPMGSAAAPTAGLHFTPELLLALRDLGIIIEYLTLHVGLDTFKPVESRLIQDHEIHTEWAQLTPESARRINEAKLKGGRIVAVGTTTVRTLETGALRSAGITGSLTTISDRDAAGETTNICPWRPVASFEGRTDLFIYPGYQFRAVDAMITNFHLPQSSLMMLVCAFAGKKQIFQAYRLAMDLRYRFYSFGDAMYIY